MSDHQHCITREALQQAVDYRDLRIGRLANALDQALIRAAQAEAASKQAEQLLATRDARIVELEEMVADLTEDDDEEDGDSED